MTNRRVVLSRIILMLLLILILVVYGSCSTRVVDLSVANALNEVVSDQGCTFRIASPFLGISMHSNNSSGFYEIKYKGNYANIVYTDYSSREQTYLCSNPVCDHNNSNCTAWVNSKGYQVIPVALDNKLALVYSPWGSS